MNEGDRSMVLCVEDNKDECELVKEILDEYDVTCVSTIREADQMLKSTDFDLVLIDEHLPDGSGMELCGKVTRGESTPPCIMISGDSFITLNEARNAGAKTLITKSMVDYIDELRSSASLYARAATA